MKVDEFVIPLIVNCDIVCQLFFCRPMETAGSLFFLIHETRLLCLFPHTLSADFISCLQSITQTRMSSKCRILIPLLFITICVFLTRQPSIQLFRMILARPHNISASSPCACDNCVTKIDPWFMGRFNKSFKPFLARTNNLSEDDFKWWTVSLTLK